MGLWSKVYDVEARMDPEGAQKVLAALRTAMSDITVARNYAERESDNAVWMTLDESRTSIKNLIQVLPVDEELSAQEADSLFPRHPNPDSYHNAIFNAFFSLSKAIDFTKANNWDEMAQSLESDAAPSLTLALILSGAISRDDPSFNL